MNAETVYTVSQSLTVEERTRLYNMLKQDFEIKIPDSSSEGHVMFSDKDALEFLMQNLF
ncbi:hypothetical protein DFQ08_1052 [Winogradskyella arenosi]|uniref:Uncharacterized protein n=1 Tax=Winogradskyella arenosi TaxID=533325 RepID=A0A368ZDU8_9FLAO|nr:hypothetical protein DFQ08_1052 [Winogradskyella arenosi]